METQVFKKLVIGFAAAFASVVGSALAADCPVPSAGGDLASETYWNGNLPGASDTVQINQASPNYSISKDVTFGSVYFNAAGTYKVTATSANINLKASSDTLRMIDSVQNRYIYLIGGTWDLNNAIFRGMGKNCSARFDGCTLKNVGIFWVTALAYTGAAATLQNGAEINCTEIRISQHSAASGKLSITEGSSLTSTGAFFTDTGTTANFNKTVNNKATVTGANSLLKCDTAIIGYKSNGHLVTIDDNAKLECTKLRIGNTDGHGSSLRVVMSGATLTADEDFELYYSDAIGNGNGVAATNATITLGGKFDNACPDSSLDFQNTAFSVDGTVDLFPKWGGCTVRFGGAQGTQPGTLKSRVNLFRNDANGGQNANNTLIIDDGFTFESTVAMKLLTHSSNSTVRVSNGASLTNANAIHIGYSDYDTSLENTVEILSGGLVEVSTFRLMGTDNRLIVSNGTVRATDRANGILLGYIGTSPKYVTSGSKVCLQGATPKLESTGNFWINGDVNLRFEIPASGYAEGYVPVTASNIVFRSAATLGIDYADYLAAGGGELTLMAFTEDITQRVDSQNPSITFKQWLKQQRDALNLPAGCRLYAVADAHGSRVVFKAGQPLGTRVFIR